MMNAPTKFEASLVSSLARNVENIQLPRSQETLGIQCLESPTINVSTFEVSQYDEQKCAETSEVRQMDAQTNA